MPAKLEVYRCEICGNVVEVIHEGLGALGCCAEDMKHLTEATADSATEKHVPLVARIGNCVHVEVGSTAHPMEEDHYIEWIEIEADGKAYRKFLNPGDAPQADFEVVAEGVKAREYCNVHGLWKGSGPC
ncbi:MAG TPA: desulfoferrodoxin [Armatimonadota bacterium]|nr:desulfoferrodoxin [Armatimonadota bacterium]